MRIAGSHFPFRRCKETIKWRGKERRCVERRGQLWSHIAAIPESGSVVVWNTKPGLNDKAAEYAWPPRR